MPEDSHAAPPRIDPTARVAEGAVLSPGVEIGPFCVIGPEVVLGPGVRIHSHVVIEGAVRIGPRTEVHPFTLLGGAPQHLRYAGEPTTLEIGADCVIREQVSIHRGTAHGRGTTILGDRVYVMAQAHVAHDCIVGNGVILTTNCTLGGHVEIGDHAIIGGVAAIHQFCRIGERAMIGGCAAILMDVIPFGSALGNHARLGGINVVGLKRAGYSRAAIHTLRAAVRDLFGPGPVPFRERIPEVAARYAGSAEVARVIDFITADAHRPILPFRAPD
jgi:UDP-N-acetylglucosamine acyltransferase